MSSMISVPIRDRWAAREVKLTKWFTEPGGTFRYGDHIAEVTIDGNCRQIVYGPDHGSDPEGGIYWHHVQEGQEVGPWGHLLEYTDWLADRPGPKAGVHGRPAPILYKRRDRYPRVFLNYRRDDADLYAGRLHETLVRKFGHDEIFMDEFSIGPGEHFPWTIQQAVWHAPVMVAMFGPRWGVKEHEWRRVDNEFDFVRRELIAALDTGTVVIPVVLPQGQLPATYGLPREIQGLADVQALTISPRHWQSDVDVIIDSISRAL